MYPRRLFAALISSVLAPLFLFTGAAASAPIESQTLRSAAGDVLIGCAASALDLQNPKLAEFILQQFSALTAHRDMMPALLVDDEGRYTFEAGDAVARFANENRLAF